MLLHSFHFDFEFGPLFVHFILSHKRLPLQILLLIIGLPVVKHSLKRLDAFSQVFQFVVKLGVLGLLFGLFDRLLHVLR